MGLAGYNSEIEREHEYKKERLRAPFLFVLPQQSLGGSALGIKSRSDDGGERDRVVSEIISTRAANIKLVDSCPNLLVGHRHLTSPSSYASYGVE